MPRPKKPVPTSQLHKQSGQAIVTISHNGTRKDMLLGVHGSAESKEEYRRVLADLSAGRLAPEEPADLTVNELCARFWKQAQEYYRHDGGRPTSELTDIQYAIRVFRTEVGHMPAREFGPKAFKAVRDAMVLKGWCWTTVNQQAHRVKRIVRWGVENGLLPADRCKALRPSADWSPVAPRRRNPNRSDRWTKITTASPFPTSGPRSAHFCNCSNSPACARAMRAASAPATSTRPPRCGGTGPRLPAEVSEQQSSYTQINAHHHPVRRASPGG